MPNLIPQPVSFVPTNDHFTPGADARVYVDSNTSEVLALGEQLAEKLRLTTAHAYSVIPKESTAPAGNFFLTTADADTSLGLEGYTLTITPSGVTLAAPHPPGIFYGIQTLYQLLPVAGRAGDTSLTLPTCTIRDVPRFPWRGMMLDVARHFFSVADVKRLIDQIAHYKINRLHLHLSDDQGWRIEIRSWENLAKLGGKTAVNGDRGGYYTQAEYKEIVAFAASRYLTIVPEIDLPGHTNAALSSYPELNCNDQAPPPYTGIEVGFSSLCLSKELTYEFVGDVLRELAELTPGPYLHVGGDEAQATPDDGYIQFIEHIQNIVTAQGKQMVGWGEVGKTKLLPTSIAQHWVGDVAAQAVTQDAKILMSPASKTYLDMQYDESSPLGLHWAGYLSVADAYNWEPADQLAGVTETNIIGVEAPSWSETLRTIKDIEYMTFPRLPGIAEIAWSPAGGRSWDEYRHRLAAHRARWQADGINFYRAPEVPWHDETF